jgi:hypothetical protein
VIVVAAGAVFLLAGVSIATADSGAKKSRRQLIELLGVLRQRQTRADRSAVVIDHLRALLPTLQDSASFDRSRSDRGRIDDDLVRAGGLGYQAGAERAVGSQVGEPPPRRVDTASCERRYLAIRQPAAR